MNLKKWQVAGALFTIVVGTLLHFVYQWSGENPIVGYFSPVNESTWEHLKLLIVPILLFALLEYFYYGKNFENFIPAKAVSILMGMSAIIILFYTYTGIIGKNFLWADIGVFILSVIFSYWINYKLLKNGLFSSKIAKQRGTLLLVVLIILMILFTIYPPQLGLFLDPVTGRYGIVTTIDK